MLIYSYVYMYKESPSSRDTVYKKYTSSLINTNTINTYSGYTILTEPLPNQVAGQLQCVDVGIPSIQV